MEQLCHLFDTCSFRLKRPQLWKDKWEGFPFELLDNEKGKENITRYLEKNKILFHADIITLLKETVYCLCFSKIGESEAHWNTYYKDTNVVRIEIEKQIFINEFAKENNSKIEDVTYFEESITESFLMKKLGTIIVPIPNGAKTFPMNGYTFKRKQQYGWEDECRFLLYDPRNLTLKRPGSGQIVFNTHPSMNIGGDTVPDEKVIKMECPINKMIVSILVHPDADECFCKEIEELCKEASVNYSGKSTMNNHPSL